MIDFLAGIADFITSVVMLIMNTLSSVLWVIQAIPSFDTTFTGVFAYSPTALLVWLELSLALTVVFAIIKLVK